MKTIIPAVIIISLLILIFCPPSSSFSAQAAARDGEATVYSLCKRVDANSNRGAVREDKTASVWAHSAKSSKTVAYTGKVYHIFFHSLILYPRLAFSGSMASGYNDWMTTRAEFKKILNKLYENDFILVDANAVREAKLAGKPLMLPEGKKPLILSVDDVNYYEYMKGDGFAERLVAVEKNRVAAEVKTPSGEIIVDYEGDVMPIVDAFVKKHPDFSLDGAKGIVAVTGYQGVFGYRITSLKGEKLSEAVEQAKKVADALKASGWKIACHSYSHSKTFRTGEITFEKLADDTRKWKETIAPVTGGTNIYISPFGLGFSARDERLKYLVSQGFDIFCPVSQTMNTNLYGSCLVSERLNFDGFTMQKYPSRITNSFFDLEGVLDGCRPATSQASLTALCLTQSCHLCSLAPLPHANFVRVGTPLM